MSGLFNRSGGATSTRRPSRVELDRLLSASETVISRHRVLRTVLVDSGIQTHPYLQITLKNLSGLLSLVKGGSYRISEGSRRGVDCNIVSSTATRSQQRNARLQVVTRHAITDGASMSVLTRDITRAHDGCTGGSLPPAMPRHYGISDEIHVCRQL